MSLDSIWGFLPKTTDSLDKLYELFKKVLGDVRRALKARRKSQMKKAVIELRNLVGEIDDILSKLSARIQVAEVRKDVDGFMLIREDMGGINLKIGEIHNSLWENVESSELKIFFNEYPKLRDAFYIKLYMEGVDPYEDLIELEPHEKLENFISWVKQVKHYTRILWKNLTNTSKPNTNFSNSRAYVDCKKKGGWVRLLLGSRQMSCSTINSS